MREIAGKKPLKDLKAKVWRVYAEVVSKDNLGLYEENGATKIAECIGMIYDLDAETVLDELKVSEIMVVFGECYIYLMDMVNGRIPESKNAIGDGQN